MHYSTVRVGGSAAVCIAGFLFQTRTSRFTMMTFYVNHSSYYSFRFVWLRVRLNFSQTLLLHFIMMIYGRHAFSFSMWKRLRKNFKSNGSLTHKQIRHWTISNKWVSLIFKIKWWRTWNLRCYNFWQLRNGWLVWYSQNNAFPIIIIAKHSVSDYVTYCSCESSLSLL